MATDRLAHTEAAPSQANTQTQVVGRPWQNASNPRDVNPDGNIVPLDALAIFNEANARRFCDPITGKLFDRTAEAVFFYDVNGDSFATPLDALNVINFLNERSSSEGESADVRTANEQEPRQLDSGAIAVPLRVSVNRFLGAGEVTAENTESGEWNDGDQQMLGSALTSTEVAAADQRFGRGTWSPEPLDSSVPFEAESVCDELWWDEFCDLFDESCLSASLHDRIGAGRGESG